MTDERIDALIRKMAATTDREPGVPASSAATLLPRVRAARHEDRTWVGRLRRDLRTSTNLDSLSDLIRTRPIFIVAGPLFVAGALLAGVLASGTTSPSPSPTPGPQTSAVAIDNASPSPVGTAPASPAPTETVNSTGQFVLSSDGRIVVVSGDGSGRHDLSDGTVDDYFPAWSPDGRYVAFFSQACRPASVSCPSKDADSTLVVIDADGTNRRTLLRKLENPALISWLADGSGVLATSYGGTSRVDRVGLDGSVSSTPLHETELKIASPDGSQVVYVGDGNIRIANRDGSNDRLLVRVNADETMSITGWSPDGQSIAYNVSSLGYPHTPQTWIVSRDGSGAHAWTDLPEHGWLLGWSPDGSWMLLLVRGDDNGVGRHYVVADADGSSPRGLGQSIDSAAWSPDGRSLIGTAGITVGSGGRSRFVVVVDPSGSAATVRIDAPWLLGYDWLPGR